MTQLQKSPRKRQEQKEKTRQKLLEVSLQLFVRKGYAGTTVRDIAESADVSVGLLFHYFPSKQAILEEHIKIAESGITSVMELLASGRRPLETFTMIVSLILGSFEEAMPKNLFLLVIQVLSSESIPAAAKRTLSAFRIVEASAPLITLGQSEKEIKAGNPLALSVVFWGAIQGVAEMLALNPDAPVPDHAIIVDILRA